MAFGSTIIDFESQTSHGDAFDGLQDSPLVVGIATFTGGEVLGLETNSIDLTHVYATGSSPGYRNPVVITFAAPIGAFSLFITNNFSDTFTVSANLGDSQTLTVAGNGNQVFALAGVGIRRVTITEQSAEWDFAIDNVTFDLKLETVTGLGPDISLVGSVSAVPEPAAGTAVAFGLIGLLASHFKLRMPVKRG